MTPYEIEVLTKVVAALKEVSPATELVRSVLPIAEELLMLDTVDDYRATHGMKYYIVVGSNHCWGRGFTPEDALANASKPKHYVLYEANTKRTPIAYIDDMGGVCWRGERPIEVERKLPKKTKVS